MRAKRPKLGGAESTRLKPGDKVYRVVEVDMPDDDAHHRHTWKVGAAEIKSASDRMIILASPHKINVMRTRFTPSMLGVLFFLDEETAIARFIENCNETISSANGRIITATRGLAWARGQTKVA